MFNGSLCGNRILLNQPRVRYAPSTERWTRAFKTDLTSYPAYTGLEMISVSAHYSSASRISGERAGLIETKSVLRKSISPLTYRINTLMAKLIKSKKFYKYLCCSRKTNI